MKLNGVVSGNHGNSRPAVASLPSSYPGRHQYNGHAAPAVPPSKPVSINTGHDSQRGQFGSRSSGNHGNPQRVSPNSVAESQANDSSKNSGHPLKVQSDANSSHSRQLTSRNNGHRGNPLKAKPDHGNSNVVAKSSPGLHQNTLGRHTHSSSILNVPYRSVLVGGRVGG